MKVTRLLPVIILMMSVKFVMGQQRPLVFQSDFGLKDAAVSEMKGVAVSVSQDLKIFDVTHEIPAYNIWEASYRLFQAAPYWPKGTVFVSIVDPGVGSSRKSVVARTRSGHFFVTPDNGTLTLIADHLGIEEVREIDEAKNRLKNSRKSYTFHGRDVYAYTGARLAAGVITFKEVGPRVSNEVVRLPYQKAEYKNGEVRGNIPVLDVQYGNLWSNIDQSTFQQLGVAFGDKLTVKILHADQPVFEGDVSYGKTFSDAGIGKPIAYINSLLNFSVAINQGNFAALYNVSSGPDWSIVVKKNK